MKIKAICISCITAASVSALFGGTFEDEWFKVVTPDKVTPNIGFQVLVTLKKDLSHGENVSVHMHQFGKDGKWMNTGEWRPPQEMKKNETKAFIFTAKGDSEKFGHYGPFVFSAPDGNFDKATHKLFCGTISWSISPEEAARRAAEAEEKARREKPPAGITYKKSWIEVKGIYAHGTNRELNAVTEGEPFDIEAEYYLDPSEYWNNKAHIAFMPCGPWIDNPDGEYTKNRQHINIPGTGWDFKAVKPGRGTVRSTQKISSAFRYNSLFYHVRFRGGNDVDFPWSKIAAIPKIIRRINGFDIVAPVSGGLFVEGQEAPFVNLISGEGAAGGESIALTVYGIGKNGEGARKLMEKRTALPPAGQTNRVELSEAFKDYRGVALVHGEMNGTAVDSFVGLIPNTSIPESAGRINIFGGTDIRTAEEAETAEKLGLSVCRLFVNWSTLVPQYGTYKFKALDAIVENLLLHNIKPWILLVGAPEWILPANLHSAEFCPFPFDENAWRECAEEITEHYADKAFCIEWLNEIVPGHLTDDPVGDYMRFCKTGFEKLRSANPEILSAMAGGLWPRNYRTDLIAAGIGKYVDVLPVHYSSYESVKEAVSDAAAGGIPQVWDNESAAGISVWNMPGLEALTKSIMQSRYVMRNWPGSLIAGAKGIIYFGGEANPAGNWKYLLDEYTPRPVAATLAVLASKLSTAKPTGAAYLEPGALLFTFEKTDGSAMFFLSSANSDPGAPGMHITLPVGNVGAIKKTDHQGNAEIIPASGGYAKLKVSAMPQIYEGAELPQLAVLSSMEIEGQDCMSPLPSVRIAQGTEPNINISVSNPLSTNIVGTLSLTIDKRKTGSRQFSLLPGEHKNLSFHLDFVPDGKTSGNVELTWENFNASASRKIAVEVINPESLGNLVKNPGFESGGGSMNGWTGQGRVIALDKTIPGGSGHAASIDHCSGYNQFFQQIEIPSPGMDYLYTAWMKTENMYAGSNVSVIKKDGSVRDMYIVNVFQAPRTTPGWQFMTKRISTSADDVKIQLQPVAKGEDGYALYDNIRLTVYEGTDYSIEAGFSEKPKIVDGDLSDWDKTNPMPLLCANQVISSGGYAWSPENVSGKAFFSWDSDALYIGAEVFDDKHCALTGEKAKSGDSLQIGLHPAYRKPDTGGNAVEWLISSASPGGGSGKHTIFRPPSHCAGLKSGQLAKDSSVYDVCIKTEGQTTVYEIRIPWSETGGFRPQAGAGLGLSVRLHDSDGDDAHGIVSWGLGLEPWHPESFGSLKLVK